MPKYIHSKGGTTVKVDLPDFKQATKDLGIDSAGKVQAFATKRAAMRMDKFTPKREGVLISTKDYTSVPTEVTYIQPYARNMYFGIDQRTGRNWTYTGAPQRGGFWDERMMAAEGDQLARDIQAYSDKLSGGDQLVQGLDGVP